MLIGLGAGLLFIPLFVLLGTVVAGIRGQRFHTSVWLLLFLAALVFLGVWVLLSGIGVGG